MYSVALKKSLLLQFDSCKHLLWPSLYPTHSLSKLFSTIPPPVSLPHLFAPFFPTFLSPPSLSLQAFLPIPAPCLLLCSSPFTGYISAHRLYFMPHDSHICSLTAVWRSSSVSQKAMKCTTVTDLETFLLVGYIYAQWFTYICSWMLFWRCSAFSQKDLGSTSFLDSTQKVSALWSSVKNKLFLHFFFKRWSKKVSASEIKRGQPYWDSCWGN